jgi:hypothetical protein
MMGSLLSVVLPSSCIIKLPFYYERPPMFK